MAVHSCINSGVYQNVICQGSPVALFFEFIVLVPNGSGFASHFLTTTDAHESEYMKIHTF